MAKEPQNIENEAKVPKKAELNVKELCLTFIPTILHLVAVIFLFISGAEIVLRYRLLILGYLPNEVQKMTMDYSITIFAGCAIYLLTYALKVKDMAKEIFAKDVPPYQK